MPNLSWHDSLALLSCITSGVGLWYCCHTQTQNPNESEAMSETLVRMTFAYWIVYCMTKAAEKCWDTIPQDLACSLHILALLSYILTFCCVLTIPLHLIEQQYWQPE